MGLTTVQRYCAACDDISQGSVATHLMCDGIFSDLIIANFENLLIFNEVTEYKKIVLNFLGHPVC